MVSLIAIVVISFILFFFNLYVEHLKFEHLKEINSLKNELHSLQIDKVSIMNKITEKVSILQTSTEPFISYSTVIYGILAIILISVSIYGVYSLFSTVDSAPFETVLESNTSNALGVVEVNKAIGDVVNNIDHNFNLFTNETVVLLNNELIAVNLKIDSIEHKINLLSLSSQNITPEVATTLQRGGENFETLFQLM